METKTWQDVVNIEKEYEKWQDTEDEVRSFPEWLAEISFKAGMKEMVEWIQKYNMGLQYSYLDRYNQPTNEFEFIIPEIEWQAKLKEWGIDKAR